jgi:hypothetical protein
MLADAVNGHDDIVCVVALRFAAPFRPRLSREPSNVRLGESLTRVPNPDPDPDPDPDAAWTRHADRRADAAALGCVNAAPPTLENVHGAAGDVRRPSLALASVAAVERRIAHARRRPAGRGP